MRTEPEAELWQGKDPVKSLFSEQMEECFQVVAESRVLFVFLMIDLATLGLYSCKAITN